MTIIGEGGCAVVTALWGVQAMNGNAVLHEGVPAFVRRRLSELGITQTELAVRMGVSNNTVNRIVHNRNQNYRPNLELARKLAEALEVTLMDLDRGAGYPVPGEAELALDNAAKIRRALADIEAMPLEEEDKAVLRAALLVAEKRLRDQG